MAITVGTLKQLSDQPGTVRAAVLLQSDKVLQNPMTDVATPQSMTRIYETLGLTKDYFVIETFLTQIASGAGAFAYSFSMKFAKAGVKLNSITGPKGDDGIRGPAGPLGPKGLPGDKGDPGSLVGPAGGDLSGTYPDPVVAQIQGMPVASTVPSNGDSLIWSTLNGRWEFGPTSIGGPAGGDLSGTYPDPTVAQIQGYYVAPLAPSTNNVLAWDNAALHWEPTQLTEDMILPAFAVTGMSTAAPTVALVEAGSTVVLPRFSASYSTMPDSVDFNDGVTVGPLVTPFSTCISTHSFTNLICTSAPFSVAAVKGGLTRTGSCSIVWTQKSYWFVDVHQPIVTEAWIQSHMGVLATGRVGATVTAGPGQHIYYVYRNFYGGSQVWVNGFQGGFDEINPALSMTNSFGVTDNYFVYESTNANLGPTQIAVTAAV